MPPVKKVFTLINLAALLLAALLVALLVAPRQALAADPPRVGIQIGHKDSDKLPDSLAALRTATGTSGGGMSEVELNEAMALRVAERLQAAGVVVDLIPATVPPGYQADAFVALHADNYPGPQIHGWKLATFFRSSQASLDLASSLSSSYGALGMPHDPIMTANMRGYYAFNYRRYKHAIAPTTPGVILEMGYMSSPDDMALLRDTPDMVADAITSGILGYLGTRDQQDESSRTPVDPPLLSVDDATVARQQPSAEAPELATVPAAARLVPVEQRGDWYRVLLPAAERLSGWIYLGARG
jgi:hypothetical protein